jgi:hypothetical protein
MRPRPIKGEFGGYIVVYNNKKKKKKIKITLPSTHWPKEGF